MAIAKFNNNPDRPGQLVALNTEASAVLDRMNQPLSEEASDMRRQVKGESAGVHAIFESSSTDSGDYVPGSAGSLGGVVFMHDKDGNVSFALKAGDERFEHKSAKAAEKIIDQTAKQGAQKFTVTTPYGDVNGASEKEAHDHVTEKYKLRYRDPNNESFSEVDKPPLGPGWVRVPVLTEAQRLQKQSYLAMGFTESEAEFAAAGRHESVKDAGQELRDLLGR
jgi:hypothetical protein